MKKALLLILLCLVSGLAFARSSDPVTTSVDANSQPTGTVNVSFEGQSNYDSVGAWGADSGAPGYIVLKGCNDANRCFPYYYWVGPDGTLRQASYITIKNYASFPNVATWSTSTMGGSKVGSQ